MRYWLFIVMAQFPTLWESMVKAGVAAQHYPLGWTNATKNVNLLGKIARGDKIVASFRKHRFGGYATVTSEFYRGGHPLNVDGHLAFAERFNVDWTTLPLTIAPPAKKGEENCTGTILPTISTNGAPYIKCDDLKRQGYAVDLQYGACVTQIDNRTFDALKQRLDAAGAVRQAPDVNRSPLVPTVDVDSSLYEGAKQQIDVNAYERNEQARRECIAHHGTCCSVCHVTLDEVYGEIAADFVHVHHLTPLSDIGKKYKVDPVKDLRPVCPNCHAILHRRKPAFSIEEVQEFLKKQDRPAPLSPWPTKNAPSQENHTQGPCGEVTSTCPKCGGSETIPVVYGYPTENTRAQAEKGLVKLGECCAEASAPDVYCKACEYRWKNEQPAKL